MRAAVIRSVFVVTVFFFLLRTPEAANESAVEVKVGLVLDFGTPIAKFINSCIGLALEDLYYGTNNYTKRLIIHSRDYRDGVVGAASAALDLLKNEKVEAILGPLRSSEAKFVANLGDKTRVPIISFAATSPSLSLTKHPYFIRTAQNDRFQKDAIVAILKNYGWKETVPIYEDDDFGKGMIPFLTDALQMNDIKVPTRSLLPTRCSKDFIKAEMYKLMSMQTRVFIVHASPPLAVRLFLCLHEIEMMSKDYVWIVTNGVANLLGFGDLNSSVIPAMQGVLGVKTAVPESKELADLTSRWSRRYLLENPNDLHEIPMEVPVYGLWAYDTIKALAAAAEKADSGDSKFFFPNIGTSNSSEFNYLAISQTGPGLLSQMLGTNSTGLSGEFRLENGELKPGKLHIVNVIGKGEREVGVWIPGNGNSQTPGEQSTKLELKTVVWPGDPGAAPKGWVEPTNPGKKMRVGVPVKTGFREFVNVNKDKATNVTTVTGYCIDVFNAALDLIPYSLSYEFLPFASADGKPRGSYDELVDQLYKGEYDAVVGDITIRANRMNYVDFTLPYTESGVYMLVQQEEESKTSALIFLKPFTMKLWVTTAGSFVFTGFVVWKLEHRTNRDFNGPLLEQIGLTLYFVFSTMVFAHRERLSSNLTRFVVIVWVFVVLILTSSYTASLTSMLTVHQLKPAFTSLESVVKKGGNIGYLEGSFLRDVLTEQHKVSKSKLIVYSTPEQYKEGLMNGSTNGGVSAIVDEKPYLNHFLTKYCSGFTIVGPIHKTGGLGFVFPKGSPLVPDISRALLNITQGDGMTAIERAWIGNAGACAEPGPGVNSNSLTFWEFRGLFLVTGTTSIGALIILSLSLLQKFIKNQFTADVPTETCFLRKIEAWVRYFHQYFQKYGSTEHEN